MLYQARTAGEGALQQRDKRCRDPPATRPYLESCNSILERHMGSARCPLFLVPTRQRWDGRHVIREVVDLETRHGCVWLTTIGLRG